MMAGKHSKYFEIITLIKVNLELILYIKLTSLQTLPNKSITHYIIRAETTATALRSAGETSASALHNISETINDGTFDRYDPKRTNNMLKTIRSGYNSK